MGFKIGNIDASYLKVGSGDCSVYLGDTLLYPTTPPPTPTYQWVSYRNGDTVPTTTTVYGVKIYMNYDEDYNIIFSGATGDYIRFYPNGNFGQWSAEDENGNPINISSYFDGYEGVYTILFSDLGMGGMNIISPSTTFEDDIELYEIQ